MIKAAERSCRYCSKPVGYGNHEEFCEQNPVNLARPCGYGGCPHPGNVIYDNEWICRYHADVKSARTKLKSAVGNTYFAKSSMKRLQDEAFKIRISIPQMMYDEVEAEEHLDRVIFKAKLAGAEIR